MVLNSRMTALATVASLSIFAAGQASAITSTEKFQVSGNFQQLNTIAFGTINVLSSTLAGENGFSSGSTAISSAKADNFGGNGSLQISGDRSREVIGSIYGNGSNNIFSLSSLVSVNLAKLTAAPTPSQTHAEPVVRLHGFDSSTGTRFEITNEGVYNGGVSGVAPALDNWTDIGQKWYINVRSGGANFLAAHAGQGLSLADSGGVTGVMYVNGSQFNNGLDVLSTYFSGNTGVSGFSIGGGSGFGAGFLGYADNLRINTTQGNLVIDFEPVASPAPEPASWAMMLGGFGLLGATLRRRRATTVAA